MRNALFVTEHAAGIDAGETPVDTAPATIGAGVPDASPPPQLGKAGDAVVAQALALASSSAGLSQLPCLGV
jgi:hypothetical protein